MFKYLNPNEIVRLLKSDGLPPLFHVVVLSIIFILKSVFGQPSLLGHLATTETYPYALLQLGVVVGALWIGFQANGGSRGRDFINRYIALGSVLYLWIYLIGYIAYIALYYVLYSTVGSTIVEVFRPFGPAQLAFAAIASLAFMISIQYFLSKLAGSAAT